MKETMLSGVQGAGNVWRIQEAQPAEAARASHFTHTGAVPQLITAKREVLFRGGLVLPKVQAAPSLDLSKFCIGQKDEQQLPMYDLYAVINHYGGMIGGHYTAYARLPSDKNSQRSDVGWRLFDDSTVTTVDESQVVTRYAYVLFYRRRNSPVERPPRGPPHPTDPRAELAPSAEAAANQASLLWQELEAEEEAARRLTRSPWRPCSRRAKRLTSDCPDEGHVRYFVLGTMAAIVALFLNVFYPLIYQTRWR
uniref:Ubiquitin carboxyl-terminal hydrolase 19 n=1 Tax=Sphaerodactylus townsendi TaxID=933632 RepID=A0ACB8EH45_9SAUR